MPRMQPCACSGRRIGFAWTRRSAQLCVAAADGEDPEDLGGERRLQAEEGEAPLVVECHPTDP